MGDALALVALCCHQIGLKTLDEVAAEQPCALDLALNLCLYLCLESIRLLYVHLFGLNLRLNGHRLALLRDKGDALIDLLDELLRGYFFLHVCWVT